MNNVRRDTASAPPNSIHNGFLMQHNEPGLKPEEAPPLALRPREAAKRLRISERLLWQLTHDGHIPCVRIGTGKRRSVLYPVSLLEQWLREQAAEGGAK